MTIMEMLQQSAILTVLGMAVVFAFLAIMIVCIDLTGKLIHKAGLDKDVSENKPPEISKDVKSEIVAAISASVSEYRKDH